MTKQAQSSLRKVAVEAGVSIATVSRILHRGEAALFATETSKRVIAAAEAAGYRPNLLMRGAVTGRTRTVGVMVPNSGFFYPAMVEGIHDELSDHDYAVLLSWNKESLPPADSDRERQIIHRMVDRRVDGIILRPTHDNVSDLYFRELWERRIPLVAVDRELSGVQCDFAGTDDIAGGRMAAQYLLEQGHRRLGQLAAPEQVSTGRDRRCGFEQAVREYGHGASCLTVQSTEFHKIYREALDLLRGEPRVTAVFCPSDEAAEELYKAAVELRLRIPQDLSVIGFADLPLARYLQPGLTTVQQYPHQIGRRAAQLLLAALEENTAERACRKERIMPKLVTRASVLAPAN